MNIYVYSDESGVFDKIHNKFFVFGGLIILGTEDKDNWTRRYVAAEKAIRNRNPNLNGKELKATALSNDDKGKLYRSLNRCYKFGVVINQKQILDRIFQGKKDKQRYLDYAYKIATKRAFQNLMAHGVLDANDVERIYFFIDEHTTATNGHYELQQALEQEFRHGTYNYAYDNFYPPIFTSLKDVQLKYCDSASTRLVRAADIVANRIYYLANKNKAIGFSEVLFVTNLP